VQILTPAYRNASVQSSVPTPRADGSVARLFSRPRATLHMLIGTGGAGFTPNCATTAGVNIAPPAWDERCFLAWGLLRLTARSATRLEMDWADGSSGVVAERVDLEQDLAQPWADAGGSAPAAAAADDLPLKAGLGAGAAALVVLGGVAVVISRRRAAYGPVPSSETVPIAATGKTNPLIAGGAVSEWRASGAA